MTAQTDEQQQLAALTNHRLGPYMSFNPVSRTQVWQWCSAMGDHNPLYLHSDKLTAPPAMMQMWTMRDINDDYAPGSTDARPYQVFDDMKTMGYPANVAVSYDISFHFYLAEGQRPRHYTTVVNISDKKTTGLGSGFFVTERVEYLTETDELFAEALITYFQYQPVQNSDSAEQAPASPTLTRPELPTFSALGDAKPAVGDTLPALAIDITHKLIVGAAIATQDFIPVHHNVPAAQAASMPDIFMNILTTSGLSARFISDWAGPDSRLKKLKFSLMAPNLPGDCMVMEGEVTAIDQDGNVELAFGGRNGMGYHVKGSATLSL